jgi:hypothetical protein
MGDSRIKDVSALLSSFFDKEKLKQGERYSDFFSSWPDLVGSRLAAHSHVADVDKALLIIEAEHPGWIQLLQLRQSSILSDISKRYPELGLRGIVFRLSGQGNASQAKPSQQEMPQEVAVAEEAPWVESVEKEVEDPELKALFSSLKKTMQGKG